MFFNNLLVVTLITALKFQLICTASSSDAGRTINMQMKLRSGKTVTDNKVVSTTSTSNSSVSRGQQGRYRRKVIATASSSSSTDIPRGRGRQQRQQSGSSRQSTQTMESSMQSVRVFKRPNTANQLTAERSPSPPRSSSSNISAKEAAQIGGLRERREESTQNSSQRRSMNNDDILATRLTMPKMTPIQRRLNFESDDESGQQKVLDYSYTNNAQDFLYRRTPYNQKQQNNFSANNSSKHPESYGERPLLLPLPTSPHAETNKSDDEDQQPTMMDVDFAVPNAILRRMCQVKYPADTYTAVRSSSSLKRQQGSPNNLANSSHTMSPPTPPAAPRLARNHSRATSTTGLTPTTAAARSNRQVMGINKSPLSLIAKEMNRPVQGPFYADGPEHLVFNERMELHQRAMRISDATRRGGIDARTSTNLDEGTQRHRLELFGFVDQVIINGTQVWHL